MQRTTAMSVNLSTRRSTCGVAEPLKVKASLQKRRGSGTLMSFDSWGGMVWGVSSRRFGAEPEGELAGVGKEAGEQRGHLRGAGDLLESEDRAGQVVQGLLVHLEAVGDGQDESLRAEAGQEPEQPLDA